ncbi:hypothetical protein CIG75_05170 [Tumebacillus algifaecis]|uniref:Uncharacterized protein n=1 Tax=Tumebacillus algifaecis TaxID=1214604 RepID=A0A223CYL5_9BACL|nr:hypothetical protein CIG75_05170 [Tumebacillus algifaecis]
MVEKYKPYLHKVNDFMLYMYTDLPQFSELMQELQEHGLDSKCFYDKQWSKKEVDDAEFLILGAINECEDPVRSEFDTHFKNHCKKCKAHLEQTSDIKIRRKYVGKWDFYSAYEIRNIVSPRVKEILEREDVPGVAFRPVYTLKVEDPIGWQLIVEHILPPTHPDSNLRYSVNCPVCGLKSYVYSKTDPVAYGPEIRKLALDGFNRSHELFGGVVYPDPITIVPQRIRQLFKEHKIKGAGFAPIVIKE